MEGHKTEVHTREQSKPSRTKVIDKSESQPRSSFQVHRDWLNRADTASVAESRASSASEPLMLQRWLKEPMREQPYNNIGAVLEKKKRSLATREEEIGDGSEAGLEREQRRANEH